MNRRELFGAALGVPVGAFFSPKVVHASPDASDGLGALAKARRLAYGCAVRAERLRDDVGLRDAVLREAGMVVPENVMKWRPTAPSAEVVDYSAADTIATFAAGNRIALRGHTAAWHQNPPGWAVPILASDAGPELLLSHVRNVVGHFRGRVAEWDVVNEAIHLRDGRPQGLRNWGPYDRGGLDLLADCFTLAREADPDAVLCYNDFGLEHDVADQEDKRRAVLRFLGELKRRDAPIQCLGIQSHLIAWYPFGEDVFRRFLSEVADLGLRIRLTELDVNEQKVGGDFAQRDRFGAEVVRRYLDAALDETAVTGVLTWGLSDAGNWLTDYAPRADGLPQRSMPLDEEFQRKPIWHAMASAFRNAPAR